MATVHLIVPYKDGDAWVFSDDSKGLHRAPLGGTGGQVLEAWCRHLGLLQAAKGCVLLFSAAAFPGRQFSLHRLGVGMTELNYVLRYNAEMPDGSLFECHLPMVLQKYFNELPEEVHVQLRASKVAAAPEPAEAEPVVYCYKDYNVILQGGRYENGRVAILLIDAGDGERVAVATVNVPECPLAPDEILIKDYSENKGMAEWLNATGIVQLTGQEVPVGLTKAVKAKLLHPEWLAS